MLARAAQNLPSPSSPFIADVGRENIAQKLAAAARKPPTTPDKLQPGNKLPTANIPEAVLGDAGREGEQQDSSARKRSKRGQKSKKAALATAENAEPPPVMNVEVSRNGNDMDGAVKRGKGWRSTPLLQPSLQPEPASDKANTRKSRRRQKENVEFAGEDTTDIQDLGDFDFEGELKKFNKKQVFDEIRQGDTTADEDRLKSHNRAHRPGTYGGKNLHPTEPVLSPHLGPKYNSNELESSSDADTELNFANGRSSSRHSVSRSIHGKKPPSRTNSGQVETKAHPLAASISSERSLKGSTTSLPSRGARPLAPLSATSPMLDGMHSPFSAGLTSKPAEYPAHASRVSEPQFSIQPSSIRCPTLLPGALENLEEATMSTFGLTQYAVTETAARCIAEAAMNLAEVNGGTRRPSRSNLVRTNTFNNQITNSSHETPTVVVLAGNHAIGARALAAARHLSSRHFNIIAVESLFEVAGTQDLQMKAQTAVLRKMAGSGAGIKRGLWRKASNYIKHLAGPPAVIIDALLAGSTYDSLLTSNAEYNTNVQQETREMIDWANRSRGPVLSVACPSGVSGIDGLAPTVDGEPLAVRPDKVLALGAPMQGLLKAMEAGENWKISLADIGVNIALKSDEAVAFDGLWVVDLKYIDRDDAAEVVK